MLSLSAVQYVFHLHLVNNGSRDSDNCRVDKMTKEFLKWMSRQTTALFAGEELFYLHDVQRFLSAQEVLD